MGVTGMTISEVKGFGRQREQEIYRGAEYQVDFVPKIQLGLVVDTAIAAQVVEVIQEKAKTGKIGDGKIFVSAMEEAVSYQNRRIRYFARFSPNRDSLYAGRDTPTDFPNSKRKFKRTILYSEKGRIRIHEKISAAHTVYTCRFFHCLRRGRAPTALTNKEAIDLVQSHADYLWTLIAAALVFFMQAGFAMVEAGFTRAKNAINIMMKNLMDFSMGTLAFWAVGFGLMFGARQRLVRDIRLLLQ